jgi:hypothetical protein
MSLIKVEGGVRPRSPRHLRFNGSSEQNLQSVEASGRAVFDDVLSLLKPGHNSTIEVLNRPLPFVI